MVEGSGSRSVTDWAWQAARSHIVSRFQELKARNQTRFCLLGANMGGGLPWPFL